MVWAIPEEVENLRISPDQDPLPQAFNHHVSDRKGTVGSNSEKVADLNIDKVMNLIALSNRKVRLDRNVLNIMYIEVEAVSLKDKALFLMEHLERLL